MKINSENTLLEYQLRINRVINYINNNLDKPLSLKTLSKEAMFSSFHFHRIFHAGVGETLTRFIFRLRVQRAAKNLLFDKRKSITQIGLDCGFSSSQNFARAFKKYFNVTPSAFRKEKRHEQELTHDFFSPSPFFKKENESTSLLDVKIEQMPNFKVCYKRLIGDYDPKKIRPLFEKTLRWAQARDLVTRQAKIIGVLWDNEEIAPGGKLRYDACLTLPDKYYSDKIDIQLIAGGKCAVYHCRFTGIDFKTPWNTLVKEWLPYSGYQPDDRPYYEIYHNDGYEDPDHKWEVDICLPIKSL